MTDLRRQSLAALQGKPRDLQLMVANAALCRPQTEDALTAAARALGVLDAPYNAGQHMPRDTD